VLVIDVRLGDSEPPMVLVADPDQRYRDALSIALVREGFRVVTASNGELAVAERARARPALILLDISLARAFTATSDAGAQRRTPVILLGTSSLTLVRDTLADECVPKPFRLRYLLTLVRRLTSDDGPGDFSGVREPRTPPGI
jgi:DNA-binding response OmpR family regulator